MAAIVLVLGILTCGAGVVAIGFGVPINEFTLGNTLIVAGTTALTGGLVLLGLAAVTRELARVEGALRAARGAVVQPDRAFEVPKAPVAALGTIGPAPQEVLPLPPVAEAPPAREPRAPELRPAADGLDVSASAIERLRSSIPRAERRSEDVAETEEVPLSPGAPPSQPQSEAPPQPRVMAEAAERPSAPSDGDTAKQPRLDFLFRPRPARAPQESFESLWPKRPARAPSASANAEEAKPADAGRPAPHEEQAQAAPPQPAETGGEARTSAILKSGVVDGMAYTLYADGSIEAQLPHGTVRFGSITELRAHIENNS